jgi:hypothetical protein
VTAELEVDDKLRSQLSVMSVEVDNLLVLIEEQQSEIDRLTILCESRFNADKATSGTYHVYTSLIDKVTLKPIGVERGEGMVTVPTLPLMLSNDSKLGSALIDGSTFDLAKVEDVAFSVPFTMVDPWVGMFDVLTDKLVVVYKFNLTLTPDSTLHVSFGKVTVT